MSKRTDKVCVAMTLAGVGCFWAFDFQCVLDFMDRYWGIFW